MKQMLQKSLVAAVSAVAILTVGCELTENNQDLRGGNPIGTWKMDTSAVKLAGAPSWASVSINEERAASRGLFGRIAFYDDNTCAGELINSGRTQNFSGTWSATANQLSVDTGTEVIVGTFGLIDGALIFTTTREGEDMDVDVTFTLIPAAELPRPQVQTESNDGDGGGSSSSSSGSSGGPSGSNTFLWKPEGENDGKAVVLFPAKYRWNESGADLQIKSAYIRGGSEDGEHARTIYWPDGRNGNRVHARFGRPGEDYGNDFEVVIELKGGGEKSWDIDDGGDRQEM